MSAVEKVVEAAERRARELLDDASKYERLGMQAVADEAMRDHYRPLRTAINAVKAQAAAGSGALKSVQRAIGLLERDNTDLAVEALRQAVAALELPQNESAAIDAFVAAVVRTKPWSGLADHTPAELEAAKRTALDAGVPLREVPLDNYSHSVVCLVGFDTGEVDERPAPEVHGADDEVTHQPAQVLVEVLGLDDELTQQGLPSPGASIVVRDDKGHPHSIEFTLDTPERADAAIAALQGARELAFGPPPPGAVVSRT